MQSAETTSSPSLKKVPRDFAPYDAATRPRVLRKSKSEVVESTAHFHSPLRASYLYDSDTDSYLRVTQTLDRGAFAKFRIALNEQDHVSAATLTHPLSAFPERNKARKGNTLAVPFERILKTFDVMSVLPSPQKVHGSFRDHKGRIYLLGKLNEGCLESVLKPSSDNNQWRNHVSSKETLWLFREMAEALLKLSKTPVLHLDVTPGNFHVTRGKQARLVLSDFNLSEFVSAVAPGDRKGNIHCMAPEMTRAYVAKKLDRRVDVFSLAVCFAQLLDPEGWGTFHSVTSLPQSVSLKFAQQYFYTALMTVQESPYSEVKGASEVRKMEAQLNEVHPQLGKLVCRQMMHHDPTLRPSIEMAYERLDEWVTQSLTGIDVLSAERWLTACRDHYTEQCGLYGHDAIIEQMQRMPPRPEERQPPRPSARI